VCIDAFVLSHVQQTSAYADDVIELYAPPILLTNVFAARERVTEKLVYRVLSTVHRADCCVLIRHFLARAVKTVKRKYVISACTVVTDRSSLRSTCPLH
jgi:hypothetical protein